MKLAMTESEIKQRHRNGASVEILADLNNTSKEIIKDVLNLNKDEKVLTKEEKEKLFIEYYKKGLNDKEIAEHLDISRRTIGFWREKRGLPVIPRDAEIRKKNNLKKMVEILKEEPKIKNQELANRLKVAKPTVEAYKTELRKKGILK